MTVTLDISRLPQEAIIGEGDARINLASIVLNLMVPLDVMASGTRPLIKKNESLGFAIAKPNIFMDGWEDWDNPYDTIWFVAGWGPDRNRYIANAVRKLRAALREYMDTLMLRINRPDAFQDIVESVDNNGNFLWGDFPWGGATFVHVGDVVIPSAVSGLLEVEDDALAKLAGGLIGAEMLKFLMPEEFGPNS